MELSRIKILALLFSSITIIGLTACGTEGNSALGATGEGDITNIAPVSIPFVDPNSISRGTPFQLNGTESYDEDGEIVSYTWMRDFGRFQFEIIDGSSAVTDSSVLDIESKVSLRYPPGTHTFGLLVSDDSEASNYYTTELTVRSVLDPDPNLSHLEIQEGNDTGCNGTIISDTTQTLVLVEEINYDPVSPGAYHPTVCAVWKDGSKTYVNDEAAWRSSQPWPAFVFSPKGSYVFGRDLTQGDPAIITAFYDKMTVSFQVNVELGADDPVLESIELRAGPVTTVTELDITEGESQKVTAWGKFKGSRTKTNINEHVYYESADPRIAKSLLNSGLIRGLSEGSTTITVGWQGKTTELNVSVTQ